MADVLRIKRRASGGAAGAPSTLASAEIAYNEVDDKLYYGKGNSAGQATSIIPIAGPGMGYVTGGPFLPLTGGTLSGTLTVNAAVTTSGNITMAGQLNIVPVSGNAQIYLQKSGGGASASILAYNGATGARWSMDLGNADAESGSNAGSNFRIVRYSDASSTLGTPLVINRATGAVSMEGPVGLGGVAMPTSVYAASLIGGPLVTTWIASNLYLNAGNTAWLRLTGTGSGGVAQYDNVNNRFEWFIAPAGAINSVATLSSIATIDQSGVINAGMGLNITGRAFARQDTSFTTLYRPDAASVGIQLGGSDPSNYYTNDGHVFRNRAFTTLVAIGAGGVSVPASSGSKGLAVSNGSNSSLIYNDGQMHIWTSTTNMYFDVSVAMFIGGLYFQNSTNHGFFADGTYVYMQYWPSWYWTWTKADGTLTWNTPSGGYIFARTDWLFYSNLGGMAGYGPYSNLSDRRSKELGSVQPTTHGLATLLQLVPVEYKRIPKPRAGGEIVELPLEIGFVAQDVALVLPEAVRVLGIELPDGTGGLDDPEPTLGLTNDTITAVLVNAVKELAARVKALEGV